MLAKIFSNAENGFPKVLHLGCGSDIMENAVNVDMDFNHIDFQQKFDIVVFKGEITGPQDLPKKHFKRVEAHMVLEHIHPDLIPNLLYCLCNFLEDNGVLVATVPNFLKLSNDLCDISSLEYNYISIREYYKFREINNELLCPNMCGMVGHQSLWIKPIATMWLNQEGFALTSWENKGNHSMFTAVKRGGDHASPVE